MLPKDYWETIIFSDETSFGIFGSDGKKWVWRRDGERLKEEFMSPTVKFKGGKIFLWGCMSYKGVGRISFIDETMNRYGYVNILANNLEQSASQMGLSTFIFQQNNDPKHTSGYARDYFVTKGIEVLD